MVRNYKDLRMWKEAHKLTLDLYKITKAFPSEEKYGLISQIRRASASIGANIVEGCGQNTSASLKRYLFISYSSLKEIEYHVLLAHDLGYIAKENYKNLTNRLDTLGKMIYNFILNTPDNSNYLKPNPSKSNNPRHLTPNSFYSNNPRHQIQPTL